MDPLLSAALMGLVEGLTEFIPVSSTGHLILFGEAIGFKGDIASTFEVFIQLGAILAVVLLYWKRFTGLLNFRNPQGFQGVEGIKRIIIATIPALIAGALLHKMIKQHLFGPVTVALALIVGGIVMVFIERGGREPRVKGLDQLTKRDCFLIGMFQCFALWPGMSRSGSTIVGGIIGGVERKTAAEFSFLISVPIMMAAVAADMKESLPLLTAEHMPVFAVGFIIAFGTAIAAIRFFLKLLGRVNLAPFGYYRIALGLLVLVLARG